ncbi:MAG: hypothetical protein ACREJO_12175 [Phycisphaerales bacterium]
MATKQLSIQITAEDAASATVRKVADNVLREVGRVQSVNIKISERASKGADAVQSALKTVAATAAAVGIVATVLTAGVGLVGAKAASTTASFAGLAVQTAETTNEFAEQARQINVSTEAMSLYEHASRMANFAGDQLAAGLRKGTENIGEFVDRGVTPATARLVGLGVRLKDAAGQARSVEAVLNDLATVTGPMDQARRLALYTDFFGKAGTAVERLTAGGRLRTLRAELQSLNGVVTGGQIESANRIADSVGRVHTAWEGLKRDMMELASGPLSEVLNWTARQIGAVPGLLRADAQLFDAWRSGGAGGGRAVGDAAGAALDAQMTAATDVLLTTAKQAGLVLGHTAAEALALGFRAMMPRLADFFTDLGYNALGPYMRLVGRDMPQSATGRVTRLRGELAGTAALDPTERATLDAARSLLAQLAANPQISMPQREPWARGVVGTLGVRDDDRRRLESELRNAEVVRDAEARERIRQLGAYTDEALGLVTMAGADAGREIDRALQRMGAANDAARLLAGFFKDGRVDTGAGVSGVGAFFGQSVEEPAVNAGVWVDYVKAKAGAAADAVGKFWGKLGQAWAKTRAELEQGVRYSEGLRERMARAFGDNDAADRLALQFRQRGERVDLRRQFGDRAPAYLSTLGNTQEAERQHLELTIATREAMRELGREQDRYNTELQRFQDLGQAGLVSPGFVAVAQGDATERWRDRLEQARQSLEAIAGEFPQAAGGLRDTFTDMERQLEQVNAQLERMRMLAPPETFLDGARVALARLRYQAEDTGAFADQLVTNTTAQFTGGLANALIDGATRTRQWGTAMQEFGSNTLRMVSQMVTQFLILKAVMGLVGAFAGGAGGPSSELFANGGQSLEPGLGVGANFKSASSVAAGLGKAGRGGFGGGNTTVINVNVTGEQVATPAKAAMNGRLLADALLKQLRQSPDQRGQLREIAAA